MEVLDADGSIKDTKACVLVAEDLPRVQLCLTSLLHKTRVPTSVPTT